MIRVYVKDNTIIKTVNSSFVNSEVSPEWSTFYDVDFSISESLTFENGEVITYKSSIAFDDELSFLQWLGELTNEQSDRLSFLLQL